MEYTVNLVKKRNEFFGEDGLKRLRNIRNQAQSGLRQLENFKDGLDDFLGESLQGGKEGELYIKAHVRLQEDMQKKLFKR